VGLKATALIGATLAVGITAAMFAALGAMPARASGLSESATITVSPPPGALPGGTIGVAYSQTFTASGGTAPYTFAPGWPAGPPPGLTIDRATGVLSGSPIAAGTFAFYIVANDSLGAYGQSLYSITIVSPTITVHPATGAGGTVGVAYSQTFTGSGGTAPYTFGLGWPAPPPGGLSLDPATGVLSGTPTDAGTFSFYVNATDSFGSAGATLVSITIVSPTITVHPATALNGTIGVAYSQTFTATGGTAPYTFAIPWPALPPQGLTLDPATGVLSGTPTVLETSSFWVLATDSFGSSGETLYSIAILPPGFQLNVTTNGAGNVKSSPAGIDCGNGGAACVARFATGSPVTLTETPATSWGFATWGGACSGPSASCALTIASDTSVAATFSPPPPTITAPLTGTSTADPSVTVSGTALAGASVTVLDGATPVATATAAADGSWSLGHTFAIGAHSLSATQTISGQTSAASATVNVTIRLPRLTVTLSGTGSGTVKSASAGINCGSSCSATYPIGTVVKLVAIVAPGSTFVGWSGACSGTSLTCTVTVTSDLSVTATFSARPRGR
jgi:uncharacterized repeat protein (TIGR02543 family)